MQLAMHELAAEKCFSCAHKLGFSSRLKACQYILYICRPADAWLCVCVAVFEATLESVYLSRLIVRRLLASLLSARRGRVTRVFYLHDDLLFRAASSKALRTAPADGCASVLHTHTHTHSRAMQRAATIYETANGSGRLTPLYKAVRAAIL